MVLGRNADFACFQIFDRMVRSTVPELQLEGFRSQRVGNNLMAQADAEHGHFPNPCSYFPVNVRQRGGISRTIGKKDAVRVHGEHFLRRRVGGNYGYAEAIFPQLAQDVVFNAEVKGDDVVFRRGQSFSRNQRVHFLRCHGMGTDFVHDVAACHGGGVSGRFHGFFRSQLRGEAGSHGTGGAQMFGDFAGIHPFNADDALFFQPRAQGFRGPPVGVDFRQLRHHKTADLRFA